MYILQKRVHQHLTVQYRFKKYTFLLVYCDIVLVKKIVVGILFAFLKCFTALVMLFMLMYVEKQGVWIGYA